MGPKNVNEPVLKVRHDALQCWDPPYKSECPSCENGLLLVTREAGKLQRMDRCIGCGQRVCYLDDTINNQPIYPELSEVLKRIEDQT